MSCRNYFLFWKNKNTLTESFHTSHQGNPNWSTGPILDTQSEKIMQEMGLEPTRSCDHRHLKPARLPIPPLLHFLSCSSHVPLNKTYITRWFRICQQLFSNFFKKFQIFFFAPKSPPSAGLFVRSCITWTPGRKLPSAAQVRRKYRNQKHWTQVCGTSPVQTGSWHSRSRNLSYAGHTSSTCRRQS